MSLNRPKSLYGVTMSELIYYYIEFSLSNTDKGAVGFILAQELAILTMRRIGRP